MKKRSLEWGGWDLAPFQARNDFDMGMHKMAYEYDKENVKPRIAVVGVGGAGCNVLSAIGRSGMDVETIAINDDSSTLDSIKADRKVRIATGGDGMDPACCDSREMEIKNALVNHDIVFVVSGLGNGMGCTVAPSVIEAAKSLHEVVFNISILPFSFEAERRAAGEEAFDRVRSICDTILVDNDHIFNRMPEVNMLSAFEEVNKSIMYHIRSEISHFYDFYSDSMIESYDDDWIDDCLPLQSLIVA